MGKKWGKKKKWILSSCLLLLLLSVALLPAFLLSKTGLGLILPRLNQSINGELAITSCAGGWTQAIACQEISFNTPDGHPLFSSSQIATERSLFKLLLAPRNVGELYIDAPVIRVPVSPQTSTEKREAESVGKDRATEKGESADQQDLSAENDAATASKGKPFWEGLIAGLHVSKGRVLSPLAVSGIETLIEEIDLQARLSDGTVNYELQLQAGAQHGRVLAKGFFNLPIYNQPLSPTFVSSTELEVAQLDLTGFLQAFAAGQPAGGQLPTGRGVLNGKWQVNTAGLNNIFVQGKSTIDDFALTGGILGADYPVFKQLELVIDGVRKSENEWALSTFILNSELLSVNSNGTVDNSDGQVKASGKLQLPALFAMFPHTLKVKDDATVTEGELDFDVVLEKSGGVNTVYANARSSILRGEFKKQLILWDNPFSLSVELSQEQGNVFFQKVHLATDFLALKGSGSLDNFSLQGTADLEKASAAMGTFVDTRYKARGQAKFASSSMILEDQQYLVDTTLNIQNFAVDDVVGNFVPDHALQLAVKAIAPRSWSAGNGTLDLDVSTDSWLGDGRVQLFDMKREEKRNTKNRLNGGYAIKASLALEPLAKFINRMQPDKEPLFAKGVASITAFGKTEPQLIKIGELDLDIRDLEMQYRDIGYEDQQVRFALLGRAPEPSGNPVTVHPLVVHDEWTEYELSRKGWATFNLAQREMVLPYLSLDSGIFSISSATLHVVDWQSLLSNFTLDFSAGFTVDNFVEVMHQMDRLSDNINGKGRAMVSGKVSGREKQIEAYLQLQGQELAYIRDKKVIVENQDLNGKIELQHATGTKAVTVPHVLLQSQVLSWEGKAAFSGGNAAKITLEGKAVPDFPHVATMLEVVTGKQFNLTGRNTQNISARFPFGKKRGENDPLALIYNGGIDRIQYQGIDISNLGLSSSIEDGKGILAAAGNLNEGTVSISPFYDGTGETASLSLQQPERVLSAVRLEEPLVKNVLAKMHPLFGVLVHPKGEISMRADSFFVPIGETDKARFKTVIDVQQVQLESNVFLRQILQLVSVSGDSLDLKDAEITCEGKSGRVSCSPVHILAAEAEMTLHGSVGYDGSLDYLLVIPVTRELVGKEGYRLLEGTTIDIPIKGSVDEPLFSRDNLQQTIAGIIKQAAASAVEKQLQKVIPGFLENIFGN